MKKDAETMEDRLERLETRNRLLLAIAALGLVVFLMGALSDRDTLRVRSVQLVSDTGAVLAELAVREGNAGLYLDDEHGQNRVALFHARDATGLHINDSDGVTRVGVIQFAHGGGGVALHGKESRGAAVLYLKKEGSLRFFDAEGKVTNEIRAQQPASPN